MGGQTTVALVIVHYNNDKDTIACLQSLKKMVIPAQTTVSIIVVDNASKTPLQLSSRFIGKNTTVIRSAANLGFTGGNNLGIWHAREELHADYFLLLNNDTLVDPEFLTELLKSAKEKKQPALHVPKIYFTAGAEFHTNSYRRDERGRVIWYAGGIVDWNHLDAFHRGVDEVDRAQFDTPAETEFATGCCLLIPREVLEPVGLLDKDYFLYMEDVDYSLKAKAHGLPIYYCPKAVVWHTNAGSSGGAGGTISQYYQTRNRLLLVKKQGTRRVQLRALRFALEKVVWGSRYERRAIFDLLFQRLGKQPIL